MKKRILIVGATLLLPVLFSSCVTRKLYNEVTNKYKQTLEEKEELAKKYDELESYSKELENKKKKIQSQLDNTIDNLDKQKELYAQLKRDYSTLEKNSDEAIKAEIERLIKMEQSLNEKSNKVKELENKIAKQEENLKKLKDNLSKALYSFADKGLTVEQKNGKVYVSMENKLLFSSGSWTVSSEGVQAVKELSKVLAENPDISILIEGHTDNDKIVGNLGEGITNNWDLSTKRATAIVLLIEQTPGINRQNLTAAGRSEYSPITANTTLEGKAKNRRIEVILSPKLDEVSKMLEKL